MNPVQHPRCPPVRTLVFCARVPAVDTHVDTLWFPVYQLADPALDEKPNAHAMMVFGGANLILDMVCIQSLVQGANLKQITAWLFGHKSEVELGPTPTSEGSECLQAGSTFVAWNPTGHNFTLAVGWGGRLPTMHDRER